MAAVLYQSDVDGSPDDFKAYVWADVASRNGSGEAGLVRDYASFKLNRAQIEKARKASGRCSDSRFTECPSR